MLIKFLKLPILHCLVSIALMQMITTYFPMPALMAENIRMSGSISALIIGVIFLVSATLKFRQLRTNIKPFQEPNKLITTGVFGISRNPIYLGFVLISLSAAFYFNQLSAFLLVLMLFLLANYWYIPHEERDAARIFGPEFEAYKTRVRRWL